jgi:hypothetical protein
MAGMKEVEDMTEVEVMTGMKVMTGIKGMKNDIRKERRAALQRR